MFDFFVAKRNLGTWGKFWKIIVIQERDGIQEIIKLMSRFVRKSTQRKTENAQVVVPIVKIKVKRWILLYSFVLCTEMFKDFRWFLYVLYVRSCSLLRQKCTTCLRLMKTALIEKYFSASFLKCRQHCYTKILNIILRYCTYNWCNR